MTNALTDVALSEATLTPTPQDLLQPTSRSVSLLHNWTISFERHRHEWMRTRLAIVSARIRILTFGHILYFAAFIAASASGNYGGAFRLGGYSLLITSLLLLLFEAIHSWSFSKKPPVYEIRRNGITERGDDGPHLHVAWRDIRQLHLERDDLRPEFRSIIVTTACENRWLECFNAVRIPLPVVSKSETLEEADQSVFAALLRAFDENGLEWSVREDGKVVLNQPLKTCSGLAR